MIGRKQFIDRLVKKKYGEKGATSQDVKDVGLLYDLFLDVIRDAIFEGESLRLNGVLTVEVIKRGERKARNPRTGEIVTNPAVNVVKCSASKVMKELAKHGKGN